ncbi:MAG: hypothetical protein WC791_00755 [Candidatus Paceibacterota bacterium]|jgi:hypothetical protein
MSTSSIHKIRNTFLVAILVIVLGTMYLLNLSVMKTQKVEAGTGNNISGWAWSDTIGWISLNSTGCDKDNDGLIDSGACGGNGSMVTRDYGLSVDTTTKGAGGTGNFSGEAWSPSIGWISFDSIDNGACPSGTCQAQIDWATGAVSGWARALEACKDTNWDGTKCTSTLAGDKAGGWDGWIKLAKAAGDTGPAYGVQISGNKFSGYAWGGADVDAGGDSIPGGVSVVGWIDFAPKVNGVPIADEGQISSPSCVATMGYNLQDPNMIWGSCNATAVCDQVTYIAGNSYPNLDGVVVGACMVDGVPTGGTTVVACPGVATLVCPLLTPPTTTKTKFYQF